MNRVDEAVRMFGEGYSCSQALLAAYGPGFGVDRETCLRIAAGFGGGIGCMGGVCGALGGAFMVIGLEYGSADPSDKAAKQRTYDMVKRAAEMFEERRGTVECRKLLGFDLGTPEGQMEAKKAHSFDMCPEFVKDAAQIIEEIIADD